MEQEYKTFNQAREESASSYVIAGRPAYISNEFKTFYDNFVKPTARPTFNYLA